MPRFLGCSSSIKFDAVRPTSNPIMSPKRAEDVNPRILIDLKTSRLGVSTPPCGQTTNRNGSARTVSWLRWRSVVNSFQDVKDQLSSSGFDCGNPGEPKVVEWASARSKQQLVQPRDPHKQDRRHQRDDGDVGFLHVLTEFFRHHNTTT